MDIWKILGIAPCKDKKTITQAYREKLAVTNPEDMPEEFKELRAAYEQALEECEVSAGSMSVLELWVQKLTDLYNDFPRRINTKCWEELLNDEICQELGTRMQAEEELLHFFMQSYYIPHDVWVFLNSRFDWQERTAELYENYPKDFIDYVILQGIMFDDILPFALFSNLETEAVVRDYINLFQQARKTAAEERAAIFAEMHSMNQSHPYAQMFELTTRRYLKDDCLDEIASLYEAYKEDDYIAYQYANELYISEKYEESLDLSKKLSDADEKDVRAHYLQSLCLSALGRYKEANDILNDLLKTVSGDPSQSYEIEQKMKEYSLKLVEQYETIYQTEPNNNANKKELAWAYIQSDQNDKAIQIGREIEYGSIDDYDYYNLMVNVEIMSGNTEASLENMIRLIEVIKEMPDDETEETKKRKRRIPLLTGRKGTIYSYLKKEDKAVECFEEALELSPEHIDILTDYAKVMYTFKKYDKTVEILQRLIKVTPDSYFAYQFLADTLLKTGKDPDAYDAINRSIDLNGRELESYIIKLKILMRNSAKDPLKETLDFLKNSGAGDFLAVRFFDGYVKEEYEDDRAGALEIYKSIDEALDNGDYINVIGDIFYYRYLNAIGQDLNGNVKEDRDVMFKLADKGLKYNPDHYGLLDYEGWLLKKDERWEDAEGLYKSMLELFPNDTYTMHNLGLVYYEDLPKNVDLSKEYFLKAYQGGHKESLFYLGYSSFYMGELDEAEKYFMELREYEAEKQRIDVDSYYRMAQVEKQRKNFDKALEDINIAIENAKQRKLKMLNYYTEKQQLLRIMNRPDEAIEVVKQMMEDMEYKTGLILMTEIYTQFGQYDKALECIKQELKGDSHKSKAALGLIDNDLLNKRLAKAKMDWMNYKRVMTEHDQNSVRAMLGFYELKLKDRLSAELDEMELDKKEGNKLMFSLINVAEAYMLLGEKEKQMEYAEEALKLFAQEKGKNNIYNALYHIAAARISICLNHFEDAEKELGLARESMCLNCKYCACKDADTFAIYLLMEKGNYEQAKKLCEINAKKWPEDHNYDTLVRYMETRKKK